MRVAAIATLKALRDGKEVTAINSIEYNTTRITNVISTLRNVFGIDIITCRVPTDNNGWYGSYRLDRTAENLKRVSDVLKTFTKQNEAKTCMD